MLTTLEHNKVLIMKLNEIADQLLDIANGIEYNNISYFNPLLVSVQNKAKPDDLLLAIAVSIKNDITNGKLPSKQELSAVLQKLKMIGKNYKIKELKKPINNLSNVQLTVLINIPPIAYKSAAIPAYDTMLTAKSANIPAIAAGSKTGIYNHLFVLLLIFYSWSIASTRSSSTGTSTATSTTGTSATRVIGVRLVTIRIIHTIITC